MEAKQMSAQSMQVLKTSSDGGFTQHTEMQTARNVPCAEGEKPSGKMMDGPYGGKKPA